MYPGTVSCCRAPFEKRPPKPSEHIIGERVKEAFVAFAMADKSANAEEAERWIGGGIGEALNSHIVDYIFSYRPISLTI